MTSVSLTGSCSRASGQPPQPACPAHRLLTQDRGPTLQDPIPPHLSTLELILQPLQVQAVLEVQQLDSYATFVQFLYCTYNLLKCILLVLKSIFLTDLLLSVIAGSGQGFYSGSSSHNASGSYSTGHGPVIVTPGVATIRRTPSSKPSARRSGSVGGTGPIPIRTPVIPVKIPTVPDMPGTVNGSRSAEEMGGRRRGVDDSPDSPTFAGGGDAGTLPMVSWSGQATTNPPSVPLPNQQHLQSETGQDGGGEEGGEAREGNMLVAIRKGVKLKRTLTNDRSAPRIA